MSAPRRLGLCLALGLALGPAACGVPALDDGATCLRLEGAPGARGFAVVASDYGSTNVAVVDAAGDTVATSLLSSGAAASGLSAALTGDAVVPPDPARTRGEVVVIDRKNGVLTWVAPDRCEVVGQLSVGPRTNPYDYLEIDASKAYVARNREDPSPDLDPALRGGDVLVVDPSTRSARGVIALAPYAPTEPPNLGPFPSRLLRWQWGGRDRVLVLLQSFARGSYDEVGPAVVVLIDPATDRVTSSLTLGSSRNCGAAVALDDGRVVVGCTGLLSLDGTSPAIGTSALVVLAPSSGGPGAAELAEEASIDAATLGGAPLTPHLTVVGRDLVVTGSYGNRDAGLGDRWLLVDLSTRALAQVVASTDEPFVLGSFACLPGPEGPRCLGADATPSAARLRRFVVEGRRLIERTPAPWRDPFGLPPRTLAPL